MVPLHKGAGFFNRLRLKKTGGFHSKNPSTTFGGPPPFDKGGFYLYSGQSSSAEIPST